MEQSLNGMQTGSELSWIMLPIQGLSNHCPCNSLVVLITGGIIGGPKKTDKWSYKKSCRSRHPHSLQCGIPIQLSTRTPWTRHCWQFEVRCNVSSLSCVLQLLTYHWQTWQVELRELCKQEIQGSGRPPNTTMGALSKSDARRERSRTMIRKYMSSWWDENVSWPISTTSNDCWLVDCRRGTQTGGRQ